MKLYGSWRPSRDSSSRSLHETPDVQTFIEMDTGFFHVNNKKKDPLSGAFFYETIEDYSTIILRVTLLPPAVTV
jgi:hypothetical protein